MSTETLTIVLKADGTGLTGTLRTATGQVKQFGAALDTTSGKVGATGAVARSAAKSVTEVGASAHQASGRMAALAGNVHTLGFVLATLGISVVAREMLGAGLAMDRLERSTAAAMGSQALAARELGFVREQAQRLGIYFPTLAEGYAGLAAATRGTNLQGAKTREIFLGVAEAGRAMNLSQERMQGVMNAVQQIAGKGTVSMEELRQQLGDRLPGAMQIAARAMNMTVAEFVKLVSEGKIVSEDFLPKFAAEMRKSAAVGVELAKNSPAATFDRMRTALFDLGVAAARNGGILNAMAATARALTATLNLLSGNIGVIVKGIAVMGLAYAAAFGARQLKRLSDFVQGKIAVARAEQASALAAQASARANAASATATLQAVQIERAAAAAALQTANLRQMAASRAVSASTASLGSGGFAGAVRRESIAAETVAINARNAALGRFATAGAQATRVQQAAATAATVLQAAQARVAATALTMGNAIRATGVALATAGRAMLAFVGGPIGAVVVGVTLLVTWLANSRAEARAAAEELRSSFKSARQALDDFNKAPSIAATFTLADAKASEAINNIRDRLVDLRKEQQTLLDQQARVSARFGNIDAGGGEKLRALAEESASLTRKLNALELGTSAAATTIADMVQRTAGLASVSPQARRELMGVATEVANGNLLLEDALPKWSSIIEKFHGAGAAARVNADGIRDIIAAASGATEVVGDLQKNIAQLNIRLAGLKGGTEASIKQRTGYAIMEKGGAKNMTQAELAAIGTSMREEIRLSQQVEIAEKAQADARKATTSAIREQRKEQRDKIREDNAAERATLRLNNLIRDQQNLFGGPVLKAMNDYADVVQRIDKNESDLRKQNRLNAEAVALLSKLRQEAAAANERNLEMARREEQDIKRKLNLVQSTADAYTKETREMMGSAREREVQRALIEAETAAREQYSKGLRQNIDLQAEEIAGIRATVEQGFDFRVVVTKQQQYAEAVRDSWVDAATSGARAFGNWFANGFKGAKDFASNLKSIFKRLVSDLVGMFLQRTLVDPFRRMLEQAAGGNGFMPQQAGGVQSGIGQVFGNVAQSLLVGIKSIFGRGGAAQAAIEAGTSSGMGAWSGSLVQAGSVQARVLAGMPAQGGAGSAAGAGFAMSPWMGAIGGAAMGWGVGGDTAGKIGGAVAGGVAGYGALAGYAAGSAALAGGAGIGGALMAGMGAIPIAGWVAMAAFAVNALAGGKLFGTKAKLDSGAQQFDLGPGGASGTQSSTTVRQKSFFRGREWSTTTTGLDAEAMAAVQELFDTLSKTVATASQALGVDIPDLVGGSFRREFDAKGNLTKEFGTIAGKVYNEAQDAFASRLVGENLLSVAKQAGSAAELETLAETYRTSGATLQSFATLALAVQADIKNATGLWAGSGEGVMTRIVEMVEGLAKAGEGLADAYARIAQTAAQYGDLIGGVRQQIATRGLNQYQKAQLDVELAYRGQVKQANELAKALGLTGARSEDLAAIEQLRALNMADLQTQYAAQQQAQNQSWLQDLSLSDLSPLRDDQKLTSAMDQLRQAVAGGDASRAQKLAEQALGLGRDLYASGADYNALYSTVTGMVGDLQPQTMEELAGLTNEQLGTLADLVDGLPLRIAREMAALLITAPPAGTTPLPPAPIPGIPPNPQPPGVGGGGDGGRNSDSGFMVSHDVALRMASTLETIAQTNSAMAASEQSRGLTEQLNGTRA